jgi:hypothetical protein
MRFTPEQAFLAYMAIVAVGTAATAILWDRWYIRRLLIKEFVKQLWEEHGNGD